MTKTLWNSKPSERYKNLKVPNNINELIKNIVKERDEELTKKYKIKVKIEDLLKNFGNLILALAEKIVEAKHRGV